MVDGVTVSREGFDDAWFGFRPNLQIPYSAHNVYYVIYWIEAYTRYFPLERWECLLRIGP